MSTLSLATLTRQASKTEIYEKALALAEALGLPVSTWQPGDPTRSQYHLEAEELATLEVLVVNFIRVAFLDLIAAAAEAGDAGARTWLKIRAEQDFGVTVPEATYATTDVVLTNTGGGRYPIEPGDLTFKSTTTGKTYHNTTGGTLLSGPGTTLTVTVVADEAGAESSASAGEIDQLVTTRLGVTCSNPTAAVGVDEQAPSTTVSQCRNKLSSLSPNGPKGIYEFVALSADLTGTTAVTRARSYGSTDTGDVTVYLAGPSGAVGEPDRELVEEAILEWATGLCVTPTVLSATPVPVAVTYSLWVYKSVNKTVEDIEEEVEEALEQMLAARKIGGDIVPPATTGSLYKSLIESTIRSLYTQAFRVSVSTPSGDTVLTQGQVATLGAVDGTIYIVEER